jgi:hypothetical protein
MTVQKTGPLVLLMFTVLCALPAAAVVVGVIPSAFAQEEDDTNTQVAVPIIDQDQGAANLGANLAANVDTEEIIEEAQSATPPEEGRGGGEEEEPPEFVAFCLVFTGPGGDPITGCFDTSDECEIAQDILVDLFPDILISECDGFETLPPNAADCNIVEDQEGEQIEVNCVSQEI